MKKRVRGKPPPLTLTSRRWMLSTSSAVAKSCLTHMHEMQYNCPVRGIIALAAGMVVVYHNGEDTHEQFDKVDLQCHIQTSAFLCCRKRMRCSTTSMPTHKRQGSNTHSQEIEQGSKAVLEEVLIRFSFGRPPLSRQHVCLHGDAL